MYELYEIKQDTFFIEHIRTVVSAYSKNIRQEFELKYIYSHKTDGYNNRFMEKDIFTQMSIVCICETYKWKCEPEPEQNAYIYGIQRYS